MGSMPHGPGASDSAMHLVLGLWGTYFPIHPPTAHSSIWEGQARTVALFKMLPKMSLALVQGMAITMRWLFWGEMFPIFHLWGPLYTDNQTWF